MNGNFKFLVHTSHPSTYIQLTYHLSFEIEIFEFIYEFIDYIEAILPLQEHTFSLKAIIDKVLTF